MTKNRNETGRNKKTFFPRGFLGNFIFVLLSLNAIRDVKSTKIAFENGAYNNILIAFHANMPDPGQNCRAMINDLTQTLSGTSQYLSDVTGGRASLGKVKILMPRSWTPGNCGTHQTASKDDIYEEADIRLSPLHPISQILPWTEQRKGCGHSGEAIYASPNFFADPNFTGEERSRILLHEWAKFRYGVFEEYGFEDDPYFSPCYRSNGEYHFTSCTHPRVKKLADVTTSQLDCKATVDQHRQNLLNEIKNANSSILFAPHLSGSLCSKTTHNVAATTKQNFHCNRKSASEVIFSHPDFQAAGKVSKGSQTSAFEIELVWSEDYQQAYAFVVEDTTLSREKNQLRHVKQSVAEFLHFVDGNMGILMRFGNEIETGTPTLLNTDSSKVNFLSRFPDYEMITEQNENTGEDSDVVTNETMKFSRTSVDNINPMQLATVFDSLNKALQNYTGPYKWNVILIGHSGLQNLSAALDVVKQTDYSVSVFTFNNSPEWLNWNTIKQTKALFYLPVCDQNGSPCSTETSSLVTEHLLDILSNQKPRRYFQKVIDVELRGNSEMAFYPWIPPVLPDQRFKRFLLSFPIYLADAQVTVSINPPQTGSCVMDPLYNFTGLLALDTISNNCGYQIGNWKVNVKGIPAEFPNATHILRGFVEVEGPSAGIVVSSSIAADLAKQINPSTQNMMVPLHVAVKTNQEHPVIKAEVEAKLIHGNEFGVFASSFMLNDDGVDPDITKDDGIYSAFVSGYSSLPNFHSGFISVNTTAATKSVISTKSDDNKAALLDLRLDGKCCGNFVPVATEGTISMSFYSIVLPSFRTGETLTNPSVFPPSRIVLVVENSQTVEELMLSFVAPRGDMLGGQVDHYDMCLISNDSICTSIPTIGCTPVSPGRDQLCRIDKVGLLDVFVDPSEVGDKTEVTVSCGIRGVNKESLYGALSFNPIDILFQTEDTNQTILPLRECKNISDGCLPIEIFWVLIGLMGGLVLLLVIVIVCWICMVKSDKATRKQPEENFNDKLSRIASNKAMRTKGANNPVVDEFGTKELFTAPMHRPPTPDQPVDHSFLSTVRRRSISSGDSPTKQSNEIRDTRMSSYLDKNMDRDVEEMPVFFANGNANNMNQRNNSRSSFQTPMNSAPYFGNQINDHGYYPERASRQPSNSKLPRHSRYPNPSIHNSNTTLTVPSISSMMDMNLSNESLNYREPVYASVNRNGRRSGSHIGPDRNSGISLPPNVPAKNNRHTSHLAPSYPHSGKSPRPQSSQSLDSGFVRSHSPIRSPPPIRMDHFPSSESETYSEMSRGGGNPPPPPPPMPTSLSTVPRRHNPDPYIAETPSMEATTRFTSKTPPKENGFGILAQMGPIPDRSSVLKPRQGPPPPPPRSNSLKKPPTNYTNVANGNAYNARKHNVGGDDAHADDDNDSDNWDVYDEFEFNPGVSHV